ncbi:hypothetical protein Tco_1467203 [Tanacetum coccineum]
MKHEVPNRHDDVKDFEDYDQEDGKLTNLPTFSDTDEFASNSEQAEENIDIAEEKEDVPMKDVKMDENHDIDHSDTEEALQWSFAKDPFLVVMELNDQSSFLLHTIPSFISKKVLSTREWNSRFMLWLVGYHVDDDVGTICDDGCCSRKQIWSMA